MCQERKTFQNGTTTVLQLVRPKVTTPTVCWNLSAFFPTLSDVCQISLFFARSTNTTGPPPRQIIDFPALRYFLTNHQSVSLNYWFLIGYFKHDLLNPLLRLWMPWKKSSHGLVLNRNIHFLILTVTSYKFYLKSILNYNWILY